MRSAAPSAPTAIKHLETWTDSGPGIAFLPAIRGVSLDAHDQRSAPTFAIPLVRRPSSSGRDPSTVGRTGNVLPHWAEMARLPLWQGVELALLILMPFAHA